MTSWWSPEGLQAYAAVAGIGGALFIYFRYQRAAARRGAYLIEVERAKSVEVVAEVVPNRHRLEDINRPNVSIWNAERHFV